MGKCEICGKATTVEEAVRRKANDEYPVVYWPAVFHKNGELGHVECFVAAGQLCHPDAIAECLAMQTKEEKP